MCVVSDKIKFCTCKSPSIDKLNNYWLLHRWEKDKDEFVLGEPMMPSELTDPDFIINNTTLENRLNEPGAFDFPIVFKPKDQLEIVFNNFAKDDSNRLTYCFRFKKGKWVKEEYDVFELMSHYEEYAFGKMKNFKA
ncbi:hypothetical protein [Adhaeribacter rhizoryzae]|uniref:Uncharacterized protein n=1 Tax=Adhaeribacter rhizoryzae TaxID=2607907 RepID=A0A5M6D863_9BACT|nr:hypothetical protein [Adhaeribacter rhizoryzae]KAA5542059.1 hypothetical protein F0145_19930 [Adhaeribacter rhizoryzae]